ncbi:hypothetical protein HLH33_08265 [Gluconacetobacter diazotrophicus]|uniref:Polysaccharide pyruvyl transferase domain-containing protein n=1 Tax=Gluconacetobacter diazotrophicus TaxID=33996 RepID=A0A7W4I4M4_GLUDI|nr:polysaccharide pyruvyl transferase family protein [Gluconacetobacter diazotrophicus]MBB2156303.1 hypothetical protein [Gluconacetobacter diazotrophicus]
MLYENHPRRILPSEMQKNVISSSDRPIIQCIGWYNKNNFGDDLMALGLSILFPDFDLKFSSEFIHPEARAVILGGGDVIDDYYIKIIEDRKLPVIIFGAGLRSWTELELLSHLDLRLAIMRNYNDYVAVAAQGYRAFHGADPGFATWTPAVVKNKFRSDEKPKLMIALNDEFNARWRIPNPDRMMHFFWANYVSEVLARAASVWENDWWTVWACFSTKQPLDRAMAYDITQRMSPPLIEFDQVNMVDLGQSLDIYADMQASVSLRYHGAVLAVMTGTPFVAVSPALKTDNFMRENDLEDLLVPSNSIDYDVLLSKFNTSVTDKAMQSRLTNVAATNHARLKKAAEEAAAVLRAII